LSKKSGNSLIVKLKVSVALAAILVMLHLGAASLLFSVTIPLTVRAILLVAVTLSLVQVLMQHALRRGPGTIVALRLNEDGELLLQSGKRAPWRTAVIRRRFVHRRLVLLSMRVAGQRLPKTLVLAADAVEPDVFRRLRAALLVRPRNRAA